MEYYPDEDDQKDYHEYPKRSRGKENYPPDRRKREKYQLDDYEPEPQDDFENSDAPATGAEVPVPSQDLVKCDDCWKKCTVVLCEECCDSGTPCDSCPPDDSHATTCKICTRTICRECFNTRLKKCDTHLLAYRMCILCIQKCN